MRTALAYFCSFALTAPARHVLAVAVLATAAPALSQTRSGTLVDEAGQTLIGATVEALPTGIGTATDADGAWVLDVADVDSLRFSYVGYAARTLAVEALPQNTPLVLSSGLDLADVTVTARQRGTFTSTLATHNVESITSQELKKAPCCNLGESFETNAAVDASFRDAATGARELQLLGLRGIYAQLLLEKRPVLYGLSAPIALDLVPGTWIESIQIGKGASSVQTGPNALAGQVNTELQKPAESDRLFVNGFAAGTGRFETNVHAARRWNDAHSSGLLLHGSQNLQAHDRDGDGFYEQPGRRTLTGMARHFMRGDKWVGQVNVWGAKDEREGGQIDHDAGDIEGHVHSGERYAISQDNERVEAFAKTGYIGFARPATSVGLIASATYHRLDNRYGRLDHRGQQRSGYLSAMFASYLGNTAHAYTAGATVSYDDYAETLGRDVLDRTERVVGAFAEYTYDRAPTATSAGFSVIAGLRLDHHSLGGAQLLPRLNLKYNPTERTALRASVGRACRSAQVVAENLRLLPSSRRFVIAEPLRLETGWNYGVNATHRLGEEGTERDFRPNARLGLDFYVTDFANVAVVDQESTTGFTLVGNGPGRSYSGLASVDVDPVRGLGVKLGVRYVDSRQTYLDGIERQVPYVAQWRGLAAVDYELPSKRWRLNANVQAIGAQRLPGETAFAALPSDTRQPLLFASPAFALVNAQATYVVNDLLEVYGGAENIGDVRQREAVIGAEDPFGASYFDASRVYAPLMGAMPFVGLRWRLGQ